jgi:hypothetical protein
MSKGILHSALQNPRLRLELEFREPADATSGIHSSWKLADITDLDAQDSTGWFEFCRFILPTEAVSAFSEI